MQIDNRTIVLYDMFGPNQPDNILLSALNGPERI